MSTLFNLITILIVAVVSYLYGIKQGYDIDKEMNKQYDRELIKLKKRVKEAEDWYYGR